MTAPTDKKRRVVIHDPDLGKIEVDVPADTVDWETGIEQVREDLEARRARGERLFPPGKDVRCPECHETTLRGRNDLTYHAARSPYGHIVLTNVHGAECTRCGARSYEPYSLLDIDDVELPRAPTDYEVTVRSVGTRSLGTSWPRDLQRLLGLHAGQRGHAQVLDSRTVLIRFDPDDDAQAA